MLKITKIHRELGYITGRLFFHADYGWEFFWEGDKPACHAYLKERIKWN